MATVTEFELGEKVAFSKTLRRIGRLDGKKRVNVKTWEYTDYSWLPPEPERIGFIVGVRVLSNGDVSYDGDGVPEYEASSHFTAYVIAYDLRRAHVLVRPEDILHLDRMELF